jgi:hypothetical protein
MIVEPVHIREARAMPPCGTIHILDVDPRLQPGAADLPYPQHNADFGIEQDFLRYLRRTPGALAPSAQAATWHYLPAFWTRWHFNHDWGRVDNDLLTRLAHGAMFDAERTFTVCQNDDGPMVDLGATQLFLASRKSPVGIDVPLLSVPLWAPRIPRRRRFLAGFIGRLSTHPLRERMALALEGREDVFVTGDLTGPKRFAKAILSCRIGLSPRGYGGSSFRLYEIAQLGRVPYLIGEWDTRPFKRFIDWDAISLWSATPEEAPAVIDSKSPAELDAMGRRAARVWADDLTFGKWCRYVLRELAELSPRP